MESKQKVILSLVIVFAVFFVSMVVSTAFNFRDYGIKTAEKRAELTAEIVKSGLTAHMVNGIMDQRKYFLDKIEDAENINELWVARAPSVISQYGRGLSNEIARDKIDRNVLKNGETTADVVETPNKSLLRVTIPYIASEFGNPNCLSCHNAKDGEVLGAVSMIIDITDIRLSSLKTVLYNVGLTLIVIILVFLIINRFIKPYVGIFYSIKEVMQNAYRGDYTTRVTGYSTPESKSVATLLNTLLEKLQKTFEELDRKVYVFIKNKNYVKENDPLVNINNTIDRLSDIYKFKQTIENDKDLEHIYSRIAYVLKERFKFDDFTIIEIDHTKKSKKIVYTEKECHCDVVEGECRANRIQSHVDSTIFANSCDLYYAQKDYICVPFTISSELSLIISISTTGEDEANRVRSYMSDVEDYVTTARPAIVSKKLMNMLNMLARVDQLTDMYNRKFLDEFVDVSIPQALRANVTYGVLMIDIDYFKMINDDYGHDVGDDAVRVVSGVIKNSIRTSDLPIRYGGEEFLVLLHNCDKENIETIAQNIRINFSKKKISTGTESFTKTLSIGYSVFPHDSQSIWKCIKFADMSLYQAKERGRNRVVKFTKDLLEDEDIGESF